MNYQYVIIGSGPTGLGAAYRLKELGINDFIILEREAYVGGLATSFVDDQGFLWDIGGHVQFSHYKYFDDLMVKALGEDGWLNHQRESWVWMRNRFVPYPFQNNIKYLPKEDMWKCLEGLIKLYKNPFSGKPKNFKEWIMATFGEGLAEVFMIPYNFKVWAHPAEEMNAVWVGERVAVTDLQRVTENILFDKDDFSWGPNNTFQFPKHGGTGAIWKAVGDLVGLENVVLNADVQHVDPQAKQITLADRRTVSYQTLLSTIPLDKFTQKINGFPQQLTDRAQGLKHSSTNVVGIGLKGKPKPETLLDDTIKALLEDGLIESEDQVVSKFLYSTDYGYPTPSVERDGILKDVLPALEPMDIYSRGRFGAWKYEVSNQDHSLMQGVEWTNRVVLGVPELTLHFPDTANAMWGKK